MTDTLSRVFAFIQQHPGTNIDRVAEEIRSPKPEVEHCFSVLRRSKTIRQYEPGKWAEWKWHQEALEDLTAAATPAPIVSTPVPAPPPPRTGRRLKTWDRKPLEALDQSLPFGCRRCSRCKEVKPLVLFGRDYCRPCTNAMEAERKRRRKAVA